MHSTQRGSAEAEMGLVLVVAAFIGLAIFSLSRKLGADFDVTLIAVFKSIGAIAAFFGIMYFLKVWHLFTEGLFVLTAIAWMFWWDVMDNVALKQVPKPLWDTDIVSLPWWDTSLAKWGVEIFIWALLAAYIYFFGSGSSSRRSYY